MGRWHRQPCKLALQARGPEFDPQNPRAKSWACSHTGFVGREVRGHICGTGGGRSSCASQYFALCGLPGFCSLPLHPVPVVSQRPRSSDERGIPTDCSQEHWPLPTSFSSSNAVYFVLAERGNVLCKHTGSEDKKALFSLSPGLL